MSVNNLDYLSTDDSDSKISHEDKQKSYEKKEVISKNIGSDITKLTINDDKQRYDIDLHRCIPPNCEKMRGEKRKQTKDPNVPKRFLSAFFWFCNDVRGKLRAVNPEYGVGELAKELAKKWSDADIAVKQKYEAIAEKDKTRYEKEMTEYKNKSESTLLQQQQMIVIKDEINENNDGEDSDE